jgi:hypothetical protein
VAADLLSIHRAFGVDLSGAEAAAEHRSDEGKLQLEKRLALLSRKDGTVGGLKPLKTRGHGIPPRSCARGLAAHAAEAAGQKSNAAYPGAAGG